MTSATQKPRAGEHVPVSVLGIVHDLTAERDSLRERERELVEVMRALTQVGTIDGNVVVGPRGWEMVQALLAKHGR